MVTGELVKYPRSPWQGIRNAARPRRTECPSEDVYRTVVIFSRKVLKIKVERTGRSRQADVAMDGNWSRARTG